MNRFIGKYLLTLAGLLFGWLVMLAPAFATVSALGTPAQVAGATTLAYTVPAGSNRLLVVTASNASATTLTSVSFGATPMTLVVQRDDTFAFDSIWRLALGSSPTASSGTITVTGFATAANTVLTAQAFANVNQATPIDGSSSNQISVGSNIGSTISLNTTTAGDLVFDIFDSFVTGGSITATPDASQTGVHDVPLAIVAPGTGNGRYRTSTKSATGSTTTMSWTSNTVAILHVAANINAATSTLPTITDVLNQTINEDGNTGALPFTIGDPDTPLANLTVTASSSNTTLVPNANLALSGSGASRNITVTPAANLSGSSTITLAVSDGTNTTSDTFVLTVNPINDLPSFVIGPNRTHSSGELAPFTFNDGATTITDGDPDFTQGITFNVSNNNNGLFASQPFINSAGRLTYAVAAAQAGVATVSVSLTDDGSAGGAALTTAIQTFSITVQAAGPVLTYSPPQLGVGFQGQSLISFFNGIDGIGVTRNGSLSITPSAGAAGQTTTLANCAVNTAGFDVSALNGLSFGPTSVAQTAALSCTSGSAPQNGILSCDETRSNTIINVRSWQVNCPTCILSADSTLDTTAPVVPPGFVGASTGELTGRITRDGGPSQCPTAKPFPGVFTNAGARRFDQYTFRTGAAQCVTARIIGGGTELFMVAYTGAFNPANLGEGYLADPGSSFSAPTGGSMSFLTNANTNYTLVVYEVNSGGGIGINYQIALDACRSAPSISNVADQSVNEDTSTAAIGFIVGDAQTPAASLTVTASSSNTALIPNANLLLGGSGANRNITITPTANLSGTSTITLTVSDGTETASDSFVLTVNPINDLPSFVIGPNRIHPSGELAPYNFNNGATAIADGDPDFTQGITFNVSNNNSGLFASQPSINSAGLLTYAVAAAQAGVATVSVSLTDDGSAGGAALTTAIQTFSITVQAAGPVLTYSPSQIGVGFQGQSLISFFNGIDGVGVTRSGSLVITPSAGAAGQTTTLANCAVNTAGFDVSALNGLSFGPTSVAQTAALSCISGSAPQNGILSCDETRSNTVSNVRSWQVNCPTCILSADSTLDTTAPVVPPGFVSASTGELTGRISRVGGPSQCPTAKPFPGVFTNAGARRFDQYTFRTGAAQCVTARIIGGGTELFMVAYTGTFNPANLSAGYLADPGSSFPAPTGGAMSFLTNANTDYTLVVHEVNSGGGIGINYQIALDACAPNANLPTLAINDVSVSEGNGGTQTVNFIVTRTGTTASAVGFSFATADDTATAGSDYVTATGTGTIPAGGATGSTQVSVTINGDAVFENTERFFVNLSAPTNATIADNQGIGTITNDDTAGVMIVQSGGSTNVTEGGATDTYTVVLTSQPSAAVTITLTGTQVGTNASSLSFTSADWNVARTVMVTATDDNVVEGTHDGSVAYTVTSGDPNYQGLALPATPVTITDNDSATVQFNPTSVSQSEASTPMAFTVTLSNPVASGVTVTVNSTAGTATSPADFTAISGGTVTFPANSTTAQTVNVVINNDALVENDEQFTLALSNPVATGAVTLGTATATGTIQDDDQQSTTTEITSDEPDPSAVDAPYTVQFTVRGQSGSPTGTVTVNDGTGASCGPVTLVAGTPPASSASCVITSTTPGTKTLTATYVPANTAFGASSDTEPHTVVVVAPALAYAPTTGSTVAFTGVTTIGTTGNGTIAATPSGGAGTGAAATTTINACTLGGTNPGSFAGAAAINLSFVGNTTTPQNLALTCTSQQTAQTATLTCNETRGSDAPVQRQWPLNCPAGTPVAPSIAYNPTTGSNIAFTGVTTIGTTGNGTIAATPSGGAGTGAAATTTINTCTLGGTNPGSFAGAAAINLSFVGNTTTPQNLALTCTSQQTAQTATLTCNETRGSDAPVQRQWPLNCPAGTPVAPSIAYNPTTGTTVAFTGVTTIGTTGNGTIAATPSGGIGTGAGATTTINGCTLGGTNPAAFAGAGAINLSFVGNTTTAQNLALTCTAGAAAQTATLTCNETRGTAPAVPRQWSLSCPAGPLLPLTAAPAIGGTVNVTGTAGGSTTTAPITLTNPNPIPVSLTCTAPAFPFTATPLVFSIPTGGNAPVTIGISPAAAGNYTGTLSCTIAGSPQVLTFNLAGTLVPAIAVDAMAAWSRWLLVLLMLFGGLALGYSRRH
jgi:hypothetical protein